MSTEQRNVGTCEELEELPVGSVIAYIGSEPDAPSIACKAAGGGWQFMGKDPAWQRRSSDLAHPAESEMRIDLRLLWDPRWGSGRAVHQ